jgi:CRISPR system Cascade subunit CasC
VTATVTTPLRPTPPARPDDLGGLLLDTTGHSGRFVVIHTLTSVTGVNINSDFDELPKRITVGGYDRLRVSSQARLRAARVWSRDYLGPADQAARTRSLPAVISGMLTAEHGHHPAEADCAAAAIVAATGMGIDWNRPDVTTAIMFVPTAAADRLAKLIHHNWDDLAEAREAVHHTIDAHRAAKSTTSGRGRRPRTHDAANTDNQAAAATDTNTAAAANHDNNNHDNNNDGDEGTGDFRVDLVPAQLRQAALSTFDPASCLDLALYGRMLVNIPGGSVDKAVQVAHSYSVDPIAEVCDQFTVVDDWQFDSVFGAANMGEVYLASGTLYGFAALDRTVLRDNLAEGHLDVENAARLAEQVFTAAITWSLPHGKRNGTGSTTLPTLVIAAATDMPVTASPAFQSPVEPPAGVTAAERLCRYLHSLSPRAPLHGGCASWISPDGSSVPALPDNITLV